MGHISIKSHIFFIFRGWDIFEQKMVTDSVVGAIFNMKVILSLFSGFGLFVNTKVILSVFSVVRAFGNKISYFHYFPRSGNFSIKKVIFSLFSVLGPFLKKAVFLCSYKGWAALGCSATPRQPVVRVR